MKPVVLLLALAAMLATPASTQAPTSSHRQRAPLFDAAKPADVALHADLGTVIERDRLAGWGLAQHRRMTAALAGLAPQRKGVIDAYVIVAGLDSDAVFGREAREVARVLARRYGAEARTLLLAGDDQRGAAAAPMGSPGNLSIALARVAELMDPAEDVLVLYTTSHGAPFGLYYNDGDQGYGAISPARLWGQLSELNIRNRLLMISACYSGIFVPMMASDTTAIVTASSADRTSFGCEADSDWTFFGDALVNQAMRKPQSLSDAAAQAQGLIATWEAKGELKPSQPQVSIGDGARRWLAVLEARLPAATGPVGRPAITQLDE